MRKFFPLPFSNFYDFEYFKSYWAEKNIHLLELQDVEDCLNRSNVVDLNRDSFFSKTDSEILNYVKAANLSIPIPQEVKYLQINHEHKISAFYNYWQSDKHLKKLYEVHLSLKPNKTVQKTIDTILSRIPIDFVAAHLRIEGDKIAFDKKNKTDIHFRTEITGHLKHILSSTCVTNYQKSHPDGNKSFPFLYLASGVFQHSEQSFLSGRANYSLAALRKIGFQNMTTRLALLGDVNYPKELLAFVDQEVSKRSTCFIPGWKDNSFSYMVLRHRQMAKGPLTMKDKGLPFFPHEHWGYR